MESIIYLSMQLYHYLYFFIVIYLFPFLNELNIDNMKTILHQSFIHHHLKYLIYRIKIINYLFDFN